jgi:hypothetical protein
MLKFNSNILKWNGKWGNAVATPEPSSVLDDMQFIYLANNFDGTSIPNSTRNANTDMSEYLAAGTLTKNGSGSNCYLTNNVNYNNYLYTTITSAQLEKMKAENSVYTFFVRVMQDTSTATGGIISWRWNGGGYIYMLRCVSKRLQIHTTGGNTLGSDFSLETDNVYKVEVNASIITAKNLTTDVSTIASTVANTRTMGTTMTSFNAGYSGEGYLDKFFGIAGIDRATTAEEDTLIKNHLMSQGV